MSQDWTFFNHCKEIKVDTFRIITIVMHVHGTAFVSDPFPTLEACEKEWMTFVRKTQAIEPPVAFVSRCIESSEIQSVYERGIKIVLWRPDT
jgi:hypothetical protein